MCEEFDVLPAVALEALEEDVCGLIFRIIDIRDYAKSYIAFTQDLKIPEISNRRNGPGIAKVREFYWEIQKEKHRLAKAAREAKGKP